MTEPGQPWVMMTGSAFSCSRADVDEVDVEPVDLGHEVRQGVQLRLAPAPVVLRRPVAREFLDHRQLHALRMVGDEFLVGPAGGRDARAQRLQFRLGGDRDRERPDRRGAGELSVVTDMRVSLGFSLVVGVLAAVLDRAGSLPGGQAVEGVLARIPFASGYRFTIACGVAAARQPYTPAVPRPYPGRTPVCDRGDQGGLCEGYGHTRT